ncbi:MAG TPA: hypothetical protein VGS22_15360 [Thermoanaerobaculia bacterium]|jgi:hypothetical protein|nr:hypothetical protein [Thermoanaerobaculia bacterium]
MTPRRSLLLAVLLIALGLAFVGPVAAGAGSPDAYRRLTLWGVPLGVLLLSILLVPRSGPAGSLSRPAGGRIGPLVAAGAAALLLDLSYLGYAQATHAATFTYGAQTLAGGRLAWVLIWALPMWIAFGVFGWERALRAGVYSGLRGRLGPFGAGAVAALAGTALALPAILPGGEVREVGFVAAGLVAIVAREAVCTILFVRGGLLAAGIFRGVSMFLEAFVLADWYSLYFPAFQVVSEAPAFYVARGLSALLALGAAVLLIRGISKETTP